MVMASGAEFFTEVNPMIQHSSSKDKSFQLFLRAKRVLQNVNSQLRDLCVSHGQEDEDQETDDCFGASQA